MAEAKERLQAPPLSETRLVAMIGSARRRHRTLWQKAHLRRLHFYNDDAVSPGADLVELGAMPAPVSHIHFQTDIIRRKWEQLKARLTENHWVAEVHPVRETSELNRKAEDFASVLNAMGQIIEERLGYTLQSALADGQIIDGYAVLHWWRMDQFYPPVPEFEYLDQLPEDPDERKRFKDEPEEEGEHAGKFRETAESLDERAKIKRARAGTPYMMAVDSLDNWAFVDDVMGAEAVAIHVRTVGVLDYGDELQEKDKIILAANDTQGGAGLRVYMETDAPATWEEARSDWDPDRTVSVATVWMRDSWYELVSATAIIDTSADLSAGEWQLVKSGRHAFGRVPAVRCSAMIYTGSNDPAKRYLPAAEGLFRRKPFFDRDMALTKGIAEWGLPRLIIVDTKGLPGGLDERGQETEGLAGDTAEADVLGPGKDIRTVVAEVTQSQMVMIQLEQQALEEAAPDTGVVELESKEQPWTARSRIQQANVTPKMQLDNQKATIRAALRSIAHDMSTPVEEHGLGGTMWVFKRGEDGEEDPRSIIGIEPGDIESLMVGVSIDAISSAEKITLVEHGVALWQAGVLTLRMLLEEYFVVPNPMDREADIVAERVFKTQLEQGRIAMWIAKNIGSKYAIGIDGQLVGFGGKTVNPEATAMARGMRPMNPMGGQEQRTIPPLVDNVAGPANAVRQPQVVG